MRGTSITLTKAANGWIVELPLPNHIYNPVEFGPDWTDPAYVGKVVGIMKEEFAKDDLVEKLQQPDEPLRTTPVQHQANVYVFATYDEASAFIKLRFT